MPTSDYTVQYKGDSASLVAANKAVEASALAMDAAITKALASIKKLNAIGSSAKLTALLGQINAVTTACSAVAPAATSAATSLKGVGSGTAKVTTTATKVTALTASLSAAQAQATATGTALKGVNGNIGKIGTSSGVAAGQANGLATAFIGVSAAGMGLRAVKKVVGEIGDALREAREHGEQMGNQSLDKRDKARQLASLMGESGPSDRVMARIYGTTMKAGMNFDEALKFNQEFEGSIPIGVQKGNIKESQKQEVAAAVAESAVRLGLDAKTAGDLIGTIAKDVDLNAQVGKDGKKMSAADAATAQIEAMAYGLNEGRGDVSVLARGEVALASKQIGAGRVRQRSDVGAIVGVGSVAGAKSGASAGTFSAWADRGLNRVGKGAGEFLEASGVNKERYFEDKVARMKTVLDEAKAASADPAKFDANKFLAEKGFGAEQDRMAIIGFVSNLKPLQDRLAKSRSIAADPSIARGRNVAFGATQTQQYRKAKARNEAAQWNTGRKTEDLQIARMEAAGELEFEGALNDPGQKVAEAIKGGFGLKEWAGLPSEHQNTIDDRVRRNLETQLRNAGVDLDKSDLYTKNGMGQRGRLSIPAALKALNKLGAPIVGPSNGLETQMQNLDVSPADKAARDKAQGMQGVPAMKPGVGAAGPAGPQASLDAGDFKAAVADFRAAVAAMGGGTGTATASNGRGGRPIGPMPEFGDAYGPTRAGSYG